MHRKNVLLVPLAAALLVTGCGSRPSGQQQMADGIEAYKAKNYTEAIARLTEAGEHITGSVDLYYLLGSAHLMQGEMGPASDAFKAALQCKPTHGESLAGLGEIAFHKEQFDEAKKCYEQALEAELASVDSRSSVLNGIALVFMARKNYAMERLNLLDAQRAAPKYSATYYNLGTLYRDVYKLYDEALDQFNLYLHLGDAADPHHEKAKNKVAQLQGLISRNAPKASESAPGTQEKVEKLISAGSEALASQFYMKAIQSFKEALRLDPASFNAQWGLGMAYTRQGLKAEALEAFRSAAKLRPTHQESYSRAATLAFQLKRYDDAENILNTAIARSPFNPETIKQTAMVYYYQHRSAEAHAYGAFYLSLLKANAQDVAFAKWLKTF